MGQSRALLIVSELIESHNEMSGAGFIVGCHPAAAGLPYMETLLILDLRSNPGRIYAKCLADELDLENWFSMIFPSVSDQIKLITNVLPGYILEVLQVSLTFACIAAGKPRKTVAINMMVSTLEHKRESKHSNTKNPQ